LQIEWRIAGYAFEPSNNQNAKSRNVSTTQILRATLEIKSRNREFAATDRVRLVSLRPLVRACLFLAAANEEA
jgi:hypothetical protein